MTDPPAVTYGQFLTWLTAQGIDPSRCLDLRLAPAHRYQETITTEPSIVIIAELAMYDRAGCPLADPAGELITETKVVPLMSLPTDQGGTDE